LGALVLVVISIVRYAYYGITSPAINISAIMCFFFGIQFALTGVLGEYMYTVLGEAKGRPIYIVDKTIGIDRAEP
jgi:dolichol-phosphate mannosyltransferase